MLSAEPPGLDYAEHKFLISENHTASKKETVEEHAKKDTEDKKEYHLLDLYCGCGAMSTGICLGMNLAGINLVTVRSNQTCIIYVVCLQYDVCYNFPILSIPLGFANGLTEYVCRNGLWT